VLLDCLAVRACPAVVCQVGRLSGPLWTESFGRLTYDSLAPEATVATIFDLASLTKVISTSSVAMAMVQDGRLSLDTPVSQVLEGWRGFDQEHDRESVTVRHLLEHSSGLPAHVPLWERLVGRNAFLNALAAVPLERPPGGRAVYSDVGFLLLGFVLEHVAGRPLDVLWNDVWSDTCGGRASLPDLVYSPGPELRERIAPTELVASRRGAGRVLQGAVHDENAAALGGVAPHAGLFGTAGAVGLFASAVLRSFTETPSTEARPMATQAVMRQFAQRSVVPGSSRALGWDTMLPTSSCGARLSASAIGHTGFTGTSLWVDWERDLYVVLLTNRVHPTRDNERFLPFRARFHDAVMEDLGI